MSIGMVWYVGGGILSRGESWHRLCYRVNRMKRSRNHTEFRTAYRDVISAAVSYQSTSAQLSDSLEKLRERFNVPSYMWQEAYTWREACITMFHHCPGKLVFCVEWEGKPIVNKWNNLPEACRQTFRDNKPLITGHYWQLSDGTIGRPFFVSGGANISDNTPHTATK